MACPITRVGKKCRSARTLGCRGAAFLRICRSAPTRVPQWHQAPSEQVEIGQRKGDVESGGVLGQTPVTHLGEAPQALDHVEGVLATRARGEHAFHVVKRLWGFTKVRYRGLAKNTARLYIAFALANLYLLRRRLMPLGYTCRC